MLKKNPTLAEQIAEDIAFSEECKQQQASQTIIEAENDRLKAINAELSETLDDLLSFCESKFEAICRKLAIFVEESVAVRSTKMTEKKDLGKEKGVATRLDMVWTVGELRKLLVPYEDQIGFGFRNQFMQTLYEVDYGDEKCVLFQ